MTVGSRLISLFTFSSLAVFICSLHSTSVAALSIEAHGARSLHNRGHDAIAKRKRSSPAKKSKRCKPRSSASLTQAPPSSSAAAPAPTSSKASSSKASSAKASPSASPSDNNNGGGDNQGGNLNIGGNNKAGLGWPNGPQDLDQWKGISTIYTWAPECPDNAAGLGIQCCPMLWGWNQVGQWQSNVVGTKQACVMGPNEPEISGQSNMDPGSGVALWKQYIQPMKAKGATLISPATTSDPAGKKWMIDFFNQCGDDKCEVDIVACHWYDVSGDALISYLEDLHNTYQKPLWLSEFACQNFNGGAQCSQDQVWAFQQKVTAFMNSADYVLKYFPFGAMQNMQGVNPDNQLMGGNGGPNSLAKAYLGI